VRAGFDASDGNRLRLSAAVNAFAAQTQSLDPDIDKVVGYRVDNHTEPFTGEFALNDPDILEAEVIHQLGPKPSHRGTYPERFFRLIADDLDHNDVPTMIELFSDGDNDDQSAATRLALRRIAKRLASHLHAQIWFFGIDKSNIEKWKDLFKPLGTRIHFCTQDELTPAAAVDVIAAASQSEN